jgi:hypothetical protein
MGFHDEWLTRFDGETYMGMYRRTLGEEGASAIARFLARNASVTKIDLRFVGVFVFVLFFLFCFC